ncbi:MAG: anti-phage ZorAB system protein ZorA [Fusobacterium sp. JB019]|nr:anti-phage ZorAB system protein ZorA [Fusobacterium sp. JB019]
MRKKRNISFWMSIVVLGALFIAGCFISYKGYETLRTPEKVSILNLTKNNSQSFSGELLLDNQKKYVQELLKDELLKKEIKDNNVIYIKNKNFSDNEYFLMLMSLLFILTLLIRVVRDKKKLSDLKKIKEIFQDGDNNFENINENIKNISIESNLVSRWKEYIETLYLKENKRYQTIDAEEIFNFDILYKEQIRSRFFLYIPQALVGIGMLGTFYGLTKGLSHLNLSNIQGIQGSVGELLSGVKTAFYTSLFGLSFSLVLTFFYHIYFGEIEKSIFNLKNIINEKFPKRVKDKVYDEIMEKLSSISETNKETSGLLGNQIEKIGVSMTETLGKFSNNIGSDFKETLTSAFDNVFSENFINGMQESLNQTLEIFKTNSDKMLEFKDQMNIAVMELKELKDSYVEAIKDSKETKVEFKSMLDQSNETTKELLENININYKENNEKIVSQYEAIHLNLVSACEKIQNISADYGVFEEKTKNIAKEMTDIQDNNLEILNKNEIFVDEIKEVLEEVRSNKEADIELKNLWTSYCESFKEVNSNLDKNSKLYKENLEQTSLEFREIIKNISEQYQTVIKDQTVDYTNEIRRGLSELFKDYDSNLALVVDKFNGVLQVFQDKMQYFSENLAETKNTIGKTSETFESYDSNLSTIVDKFNITLNNFENKMQKFTNSLLDTKEVLVKEFQEEKRLLNEKVEEIKKSN